MLPILLAIITLEVTWNPNPPTENVTHYELLISSSSTLSSPTIISVPPTVDPTDNKIHYTQSNWDTATDKYIAVRAVNSIDTGALTAAYRVGKPQVPINLIAQKK